MGQSVTVTGIVLTAMPVGEYDKRITILTRERGKITAFARGSRRPGNQLMATTCPFSFGEFELFEGRSSYTLQRASIKNYFRELVEDLDAACFGFYFMEFAEYFCQENNDEKDMLALTYLSLKALGNPDIPKELVRFVFELKSMFINGEGPNVFSCNKCGKEEKLTLFSVNRAGVFCSECAGGERGITIRDATRYTLQFIAATPAKKLYTFTVSDEVLSELRQITGEYMARYVHHEFKTLKVRL